MSHPLSPRSKHVRRARRRLGAALAMAALLAGCEDVARPRPAAADAAPALVTARAAPEAAAVRASLDDARHRLTRSVADADARVQLEGYLSDLSAALDAGDASRSRRALAFARTVVDRLSQDATARPAEKPDLAAIALALYRAEALLGRDARPPGAEPGHRE